MSMGRSYTLNSGHKIPAVGLGTWLSEPNEVRVAVEHALRSGYRHIDAAHIYENEHEVGAGWKASGVPRDQIFITSKLWNTDHHPNDVEAALDLTLKNLQTDYLDLYLIHWPVAFIKRGSELFPKDDEHMFLHSGVPTKDTWAAMEKLVDSGKVRSIGISNFTQEKTEELLKTARIKPAVNQIEAHPHLQQPKLLEYLKSKDILVESYSPLGNNIYGYTRTIEDPKIQEIAKKLGVDPAQLLISWAVQRGTVVLPKSVTPARIESNFKDFVIPDAEFNELNKLDKNLRFNLPFDWAVDIFDELGPEEILKKAKGAAAESKAKASS